MSNDEYALTTKSINELKTLAAPDTGDYLVIWDASAREFKKIDAEYYGAV